MELFRISTTNASKEKVIELYEEIKKELSQLHTKQFGEKINVIIDQAELCCTAILPQFQLQRDAKTIYEKVSNGIAEFIINEIENVMIHHMIRRYHKVYDENEMKSIEKYCKQLLNNELAEENSVDGRQQRKLKIANAVKSYLADHTMLNIDGFVQFRLPSYREELHDVVDYAIDEFLMEKQYQEFISLLKYFVYVQDTKVSEVHIIHKYGNDFIILNDQMKPIENKKTEGFVVEMIDMDINYEDMIISSLISISPQKVYIHTREKDLQVIKTIQHIFEDRTILCHDCSVCVPVLDKFSLDR